MVMKARVITEADRQVFDDYIASVPKGHILQSYEWGEVKARTGWEAIRLLVEEDGKPVAAVSLLKRKIPVIGMSIFYAPRGPVWDITNEDVFDFLLSEIKAQAKKHKAIFLKIDPDIKSSNEDFHQMLLKRGFKSAEVGEGFEGVQPRYVFRLDITPDEETLLANMHQKTRYNIRLAGRKGVTIKEGTKDDLPEFYRILKETCERDKFLVRSYSYFEDMWTYLVERGLAKIFMAEYEGQYIAGTLALIFGEKCWYLYGASSNEHRNVMPNYLIQWTMIQWAKANGCTLYDFRGVPGDVGEDHPLYGLVKFKRGFNGEYTQFVGEFDLVYKPFWNWFWNTFEPIYQKLVRKRIAAKKKRSAQ